MAPPPVHHRRPRQAKWPRTKADLERPFGFVGCGCCPTKPRVVCAQVACEEAIEACGGVPDRCACPAVLNPTLDAILIRPPFQGEPFNRTPCPHFFLRLRLARCACVQSQKPPPRPPKGEICDYQSVLLQYVSRGLYVSLSCMCSAGYQLDRPKTL